MQQTKHSDLKQTGTTATLRLAAVLVTCLIFCLSLCLTSCGDAQPENTPADSAQVVASDSVNAVNSNGATNKSGLSNQAQSEDQTAAVQDGANAVTTDSVDSGSDGLLESISRKSETEKWSVTAKEIVFAILALGLFWICMRFLQRGLESLAESRAHWRFTIKRIIPIVGILGWTICLYLVVSLILQPPIETVIAFTASAGIALGFASQDILKNVFGGIMILFDRPFQVGDKIDVGGHYGEVLQIGLRTVRLVTPDDSVVSVPNGEIMNQSVSNANSGETNCQVVAELYLPAHINIAAAKALAHRAAVVSRYVYLKKPIAIIVKNENSMGHSVLKFRVKAYVLDIRYEFPFASQLTETIITELLSRGMVTPQDLSHMPAPAETSTTDE